MVLLHINPFMLTGAHFVAGNIVLVPLLYE